MQTFPGALEGGIKDKFQFKFYRPQCAVFYENEITLL